jgi:beta-galactosidase GanA
MSCRVKVHISVIASVSLLILSFSCAAGRASDSHLSSQPARIPHLTKQGTSTQLIVDGKPFIMLAGELHNSSASSLEYMEPMWDKLVALGLNTILATVSWELVEPQEGQFDFSLVDGLVEQARRHNLRLVFLWFASWKNAISSYVPTWVKKDLERFRRAQDKSGKNTGAISPLCNEAMKADARTFAALMRHIRRIDEGHGTVLMMQIENETGLLGSSRDFSPHANEVFAGPVPAELMAYLTAHKDSLIPEFQKIWESAGFKTSGSWSEVFGSGPEADEIFMAWHIAKYIGHAAKAGKAEYPLPMYVNAWLIQHEGQEPGKYPSGGPVSKVMDIWRAAAPDIDIYAPDIYLSDFKAVCESYARSGNPLFIPEARRGDEAARNAFWAIARHDAICFAPFGIEDISTDHPLVKSYDLLAQLTPLITKYNGTGKMVGILQQKTEEKDAEVDLGGYRAHIEYASRDRAGDKLAFGMIINTGPDEFLLAGNYFSVHFSAASPGLKYAEIAQVWEGRYENGRWIPGRCLNGDETAAHWQAKLPPNTSDIFANPDVPRILRVWLYRHD